MGCLLLLWCSCWCSYVFTNQQFCSYSCSSCGVCCGWMCLFFVCQKYVHIHLTICLKSDLNKLHIHSGYICTPGTITHSELITVWSSLAYYNIYIYISRARPPSSNQWWMLLFFLLPSDNVQHDLQQH